MQTITLYKYKRENGGITVSPVKPNCEYTEMFRLVADEGKALTKDGEDLTICIDVESAEGWYEVDAPEEEETQRECNPSSLGKKEECRQARCMSNTCYPPRDA